MFLRHRERHRPVKGGFLKRQIFVIRATVEPEFEQGTAVRGFGGLCS